MDYSKNSLLAVFIRDALKEDIGKRDITTKLIIPKDKYVKAVLLAKEGAVACGIKIASLVFRLNDKKIRFKPAALDGEYIKKGAVIASIEGKAQGILTAERVALNFLTMLSGIATKTRQYVEKVRPYKVKIMDTRKTIPGLRDLEKYAVRAGGGYNHRFRLDEMVLVKDNHIKVTRSPGHQVTSEGNLIEQIRRKVPKEIKVEIEVKNLREFKEALKSEPDIVMLDNMKITDIKRAVEIRNNLRPMTYDLRPKLEASGGITLKNVRRFAATGVDMISIGDLTHSIKTIDISLEIL